MFSNFIENVREIRVEFRENGLSKIIDFLFSNGLSKFRERDWTKIWKP